MTTEHIRVSRSDSGEISLYDETDKFMATYKGGVWIPNDIISTQDLYDNFYDIDDDAEKLRIISEARKVLGKPHPGSGQSALAKMVINVIRCLANWRGAIRQVRL